MNNMLCQSQVAKMNPDRHRHLQLLFGECFLQVNMPASKQTLNDDVIVVGRIDMTVSYLPTLFSKQSVSACLNFSLQGFPLVREYSISKF